MSPQIERVLASLNAGLPKEPGAIVTAQVGDRVLFTKAQTGCRKLNTYSAEMIKAYCDISVEPGTYGYRDWFD